MKTYDIGTNPVLIQGSLLRDNCRKHFVAEKALYEASKNSYLAYCYEVV